MNLPSSFGGPVQYCLSIFFEKPLLQPLFLHLFLSDFPGRYRNLSLQSSSSSVCVQHMLVLINKVWFVSRRRRAKLSQSCTDDLYSWRAL